MSFLKYRNTVPTAILACLLAASSAVAQNMSVIQSNSGDVFLGISMEDVTASNMSDYKLTDEKGVVVRSVQNGSPAEEAALREDDVIIEFAGQPVWSTRQFSRLVSETPAGRSVEMTVIRDGKPVRLSATLRARPERDTGQRFMGALPGELERFFDMFPGERFYVIPRDQSRPPRNTTPQRPDTQGGRQGAARSEQGPRLGVETQPLTEQMAEFLGVPDKKGILITSVLSGSASDGKLRAGDVVIGVNDREVTSAADLTNFVREASGETAIKVIRNKEQISVGVSLTPASDEETPQRGGYRL